MPLVRGASEHMHLLEHVGAGCPLGPRVRKLEQFSHCPSHRRARLRGSVRHGFPCDVYSGHCRATARRRFSVGRYSPAHQTTRRVPIINEGGGWVSTPAPKSHTRWRQSFASRRSSQMLASLAHQSPVCPFGLPVYPFGLPVCPFGLPVCPFGLPVCPFALPVCPFGLPV